MLRLAYRRAIDAAPGHRSAARGVARAQPEPVQTQLLVNVFRMVGRCAEATGVRTRIGCHSFRATGITEYLRNGGKLEIA
jgi:integrase